MEHSIEAILTDLKKGRTIFEDSKLLWRFLLSNQKRQLRLYFWESEDENSFSLNGCFWLNNGKTPHVIPA